MLCSVFWKAGVTVWNSGASKERKLGRNERLNWVVADFASRERERGNFIHCCTWSRGEEVPSLTEGAERDAEDEKGDGVGDAGAAEEMTGGDAQHQRHPDEEHRVVRLRLTHLPLPAVSPVNGSADRRDGGGRGEEEQTTIPRKRKGKKQTRESCSSSKLVSSVDKVTLPLCTKLSLSVAWAPSDLKSTSCFYEWHS